jgi:flagellar assembly factor FliW
MIAETTSVTRTVRSCMLGELTVDRSSILHFEQGLLGLPETRAFALVPAGRSGLYWLQSCEHEALTFLLVDPFEFVDGFAVDLDEDDVPGLGTVSAEDMAVLAIVTLPREAGEPPTANLQGPLMLDLASGRGVQAVLPESAWGVDWALDALRRPRLAS